MRKLILKMTMSIDGFVAGPNGELDWIFQAADPEATAWTVAVIETAGVHVMGRKTFRDMAAYWPTATGPFAPPMNEIPKVVFTRSGLDGAASAATTKALEHARAQDLPQATASADVLRSWTHPRVARGPLAEEIAALKAEAGGPIVAHGGAAFAQALVRADLVDEYWLLVHPVALGRGLSPFATVEARRALELVDLRRFAKGAAAHVYARR